MMYWSGYKPLVNEDPTYTFGDAAVSVDTSPMATVRIIAIPVARVLIVFRMVRSPSPFNNVKVTAMLHWREVDSVAAAVSPQFHRPLYKPLYELLYTRRPAGLCAQQPARSAASGC